MSKNAGEPNDFSCAAIATRLRDRMADLARELYGKENEGQSSKTQLRFGNKGSLAVEIGGDKAGTFFDHEASAGGDGLVLIRHKLGVSTKDALAWAKKWLGVPDLAPGFKKLPEDRAVKVAAIVDETDGIGGTRAQKYLHGRGITMPPPDCIRFRANAFGKYGALVALACDNDGNVLAIQQIYLTEDGQKAPLTVVKRTNKAVDNWANKASVRFPGKEPIILAEGVETALSLWQATGQETHACLGISNIGKADLPKGTRVIIARDGDVSGSKADNQLARAAARLRANCVVSVAAPPQGKDFNDILVEQGEEAIRIAIANAVVPETTDSEFCLKKLYIGSDLEIAKRVCEDLIEQHGPIVYSESFFWRYDNTHWVAFKDNELHQAVHPYDGAIYETPGEDTCQIRLSHGRVNSALKELSHLVTEHAFFADPPNGINCASGFIRFSEDGTPLLEPHSRDHRCRHTLLARWHPGTCGAPAPDTLLYKLLEGSFKDDEDKEYKQKLVGEIFAAAALRCATKLIQPKAAVFKGESAENGKSQFLDVIRGMFPPDAVCSMSASYMSDERHVVGLVGKLLNASDELSSSSAISSDSFKKIITGEPSEGRDVYKSRAEFRCEAQHIFATNVLPSFQGGMDRGVQRRLIVLPFNRVIPRSERIAGIGRRIAKEEGDILLAWVVEGGTRLIRQGEFTEPLSGKLALWEWTLGADPVIAWLEECVEFMPTTNGFPAPIASRQAYAEFESWAITEGFKKDKLPGITTFVQRVKTNAKEGFETRRRAVANYFLGMHLKKRTFQ